MSTALAPAPPDRVGRHLPGSAVRRRRLLGTCGAVAFLAVLASARYIDFAPAALLDGLDDVAGLLGRMLPPTLDDPGRIWKLALDTLLMAVLGTVLATVASVPLAFLAARNTTPHPAVYTVRAR